MLKETGKEFLFVIVLLALLSFESFSQVNDKAAFRFVFYNVENFFDIYDDPARQDNDFLPHGLMRWNSKRYNDKIKAVYKVLAAAGEWNAPALAGFCEIEKKSVLYDIINKTYLIKYNYGVIHEESEDIRGIDVCLIYRKDLLKPLGYRYLKPSDFKKEDFKTRSVLYSKWLIAQDTIHLFLNHWPSKRGGVLSGESLRRSIAGMVREKADSILDSSGGKGKIIIAGDFNCSPEDIDGLLLIMNGSHEPENHETRLMNLSEESSESGSGTYKYQGRWEMLDQVIVSRRLIECREGLYTDKGLFHVFSPGFLLQKDPSYPGFVPFSTYRGYSYVGGFSDHLPVILDLHKR